MGFHDHLYPSSYYNEEELLTSDEYPPPLVNICAKYCVNHLSKTLLEKLPSDEPIEPQIPAAAATTSSASTSSSSSSTSSAAPAATATASNHRLHQQQQQQQDDLPHPQYRLRPGVRLPSELSEKIFAYLDKHTTTAELRRSSDSSSSSSSSSGESSSSEDGEDEDGAQDDQNFLLGADGLMDEGGAAGADGEQRDRDMLDIQQRRRNILRQRRRRRRRRRRRGILVREGEDIGGVVEGRRGTGGRHGGGGKKMKRRMLWNGGIVNENGTGRGAEDEEDVEIIGFDAIVEPLFGDPSHLPLTKLNLRTSTALTDDILATLMNHHPREVDIHECTKLSLSTLDIINRNSQNLMCLSIGNTQQVLPTMSTTSRPLQKGFLECSKLLKLVIWNLSTNVPVYWDYLTHSFTQTLTSLDLSGCGEFEDFEFLRKCIRLRSLVLYNVLISGKVKEDHCVRTRRKKRSDDLLEAMDQDNENDDDEEDEQLEVMVDGDNEPIRRIVIFLKEEEEGQRLAGGDGGGGNGGGRENGDRGDESPLGVYAYRKRLEKLVNKLVAPICDLKELRHLDISTSSDPSTSASVHIGSIPSTPWSTYPNPNQVLSTIIQHLPKLTHLDISGTNLAGRGVAVLMNQQQLQQQDRGFQQPPQQQPIAAPSSPAGQSSSSEQTNSKLCDIPGLNSRVDNPLEFLGLYGTAHDASHRHCIPAKRISGDKDEGQILVACEAYIHRHEVLEKVLNDLFHLFRSERGTHITQSLRLILRAMNLHPTEKHVQISGSASLFYIVKNEQHNQGGAADEVINPPMKRMILSTIVNAMAIHKVDSTMARNGCLTICHFKIPQDVMFIYAKLVKILLKILGQSIAPHQRHESFVERIAIYLLNSLACQVEGWHKRLVGDLGAMKRMLQLIRDRLSRLECDDVMEIAWSTMWNVTDETPENCEKFLKNEGMVLFLKCLQTFPNKPELLRNMMGLLGNVAEVGALRRQLMTSEFISVFCELLDSTQDNIEVSYNAAGVLAHILSDGEEAWAITNPSRNIIQESMVRNVNRWNINSTRNINYRSFEPILRLLRITHTGECALWASWALANLTRVYPDKYVPLVEKENGLTPLRELLDAPLPPNTTPIQKDVIKYARVTLRNVEEFNASGKIDLTSFMDG